MSRFSIVLTSGTTDRFYEAVVFAAAARAQGKNVILFLRGPALKAFVENRWHASHDPAIEKGLKKHLAVAPQDTLAEIRSKGKVRVYACSAWVRILEMTPASVAARTDAVVGLNAFLSQAEEGPIIYI